MLAAAPGYVFPAMAITIAEAPDAFALALIAPLCIVREIVAPDHVFRVSAGGPLEVRVNAKRLQVTVPALLVVQGEALFLVGI